MAVGPLCPFLFLMLVVSRASVGSAKDQAFAAVVIKYPTSCRRIIVNPSEAAAAPVSATSLPGACRDICDLTDPAREGIEIEGMCDWVAMANNRSDCEGALLPFLRDMVEYKRVGTDWIVIDVDLGAGEGIAFVSPHHSRVAEDAPRFCSAYAAPHIHQLCVSELQRLADDMQRAKRPLYPSSVNGSRTSLLAPPAAPAAALPPLVGFWHVAAFSPVNPSQPPPPWLTIVHEQYQALVSSGLASKAEAIHVNVVGDAGRGVTDDVLLPGSDGSRFRVRKGEDRLDAYEFATLRRLEEYCRQDGHEHHWVWYMHSKGASRSDPDHLSLAARWRRVMDYHVVTRHEDCLVVMAQLGYMTCGVLWIGKSQYYGGNSWWARCEHVRALPLLSEVPTFDRHIAEVWVGMRDGHFAADCYPPPPESVPEAPFGEPESMDALMSPSSYRHDVNASLPTCLDRYGLSEGSRSQVA